jgi:hypothetical protein
LLLTGDATATDPVCELAPAHALVEAAVAQANRGNGVPSQQAWTYRENPA